MVCVIIVNYNGKIDTEECVKSIKKNLTDYKIIIVDNNSPKDKVIYNEIVDDKNCEIVYLEKNVGFAAGNNAGIECAKKYNPDYYFLLNNDTVIGNDCLLRLEKKAKEYNNEAVLTTKIVYYDENDCIWYGGCRYDKSVGEYKILGLREKDSVEYNQERYVEYITGCAMFIPEKVFKKVGKMSEDYFLYYEDADYCQRIRRSGFKMAYIPSVIILHKESRSTKRGSNGYHYYILRNYLIYINRFSNKKLLYLTKCFIVSYKEVFRKRMNYKVWSCAWLDYINKKFGKTNTDLSIL